MKTIHTIDEIRQIIKENKQHGKIVGLVPTMGFLHEGHLSLLEKAKAQCDLVVLSIFVNPLQFGPSEDYEKYPRNLEKDGLLAESAGVDIIFAPSVKEMYPQQQLTFIDEDLLTENLCGLSRPGHFRGVATVVTKLFNIVQPDQAFFGQKDAQQVRVIQQMVRDLNLPVEIVPCPIIREADGLAKSSRNVYLSPDERQQALSLYKAIQKAKDMYDNGEKNVNQILKTVRSIILSEPKAEIDYVKIVDLQDLTDISIIQRDALLALAIRFGGTRLIDNVILRPQEEAQLCSVQ